MLYHDFTTGNKDYKLRLSIRNVVALEKLLGCNPLAIFGDGEAIPTVTVLVNILHASLQSYHHGITLDGAYDIFEEWLSNGHVVTDFIPVVIEVYKVSGIIKIDSEKTEKN